MVVIIAKPFSEGVLVTGKQADVVLVTGLGKLDVDPDLGKEEEVLFVAPLLDGVIALEDPAWSRLLRESPGMEHKLYQFMTYF